jgi:hypothetical protein
MSSLPQPHYRQRRPQRVRPAEFTPAVLRFPDGGCTPSDLQMFSATGGLLGVPRPLNQGAHVKLMFLTETGPVLGEAELLRALSWTVQPFRFVALAEADKRRLQAAIQPLAGSAQSPEQNFIVIPDRAKQSSDIEPGLLSDEEWINKYRAAKVNRRPSRKRLFRMLFGTVTFATVCLCAIYFFSLHLAR